MFTEKTKWDLLPKQPPLPPSLLTSENVTFEVNQLHVAETRHAGRVCKGPVIDGGVSGHPSMCHCFALIILFILQPPKPPIPVLQWRPETSGALRRERGPGPRRPRPRWAELSLNAVITSTNHIELRHLNEINDDDATAVEF